MSSQTQTVSKEDLRKRATEDFQTFLYLMWKHLGLPKPTPAQYAMAEYLQHGHRLRVLAAARGFGKSWISAAYVLWQLNRDPQQKVLVLSASMDRAVAFSTFVKRVISEWWMVQHLLPGQGQRDSVVAFDVGPSRAAQAPSVKSAGITSQITGTRAHIAVLDDVEVPGNSETVLMREKLSERTKEISAILIPEKDLKEGEQTSVTVLGTPQTEDTLYAKYPPRGYEMRVWPARIPDDDTIEGYTNIGATLFPEIIDRINNGEQPGEPTDPDRFDHVDLLQRQQEYGTTGFALQFMLDSSVSDAERYPLKLRDLVVMDCNDTLAPAKVVWSGSPEYTQELPNVGMAGDRWQGRMVVQGTDGKEYGGWEPYTGTVMAIDPSGRGPDETTYAVVSYLNGQLFLRDMGGFRGDGYSDEVTAKLAHVAAKYPGRAYQIESNFGDGIFSRLLSPVLAKITGSGLGRDTTPYEVRHHTNKEHRIIDTLGPVMGQHKLIVDSEVIRRDFQNVDSGDPTGGVRRCFYQLTRITRDKDSIPHDDRLDALAMAVAYWTERMDADADRNIKSAKNAAFRREAERTAEFVMKLKPKKPSVTAKFGF